MLYVIRALRGTDSLAPSAYVKNPFALEAKYVPLDQAYRFKTREAAERHVWEGREVIDKVMQ